MPAGQSTFSSPRQGGALGGDHFHEFVPGVDERLRAFILELAGEEVHVDAGPGEPGQNFLAVATVGGSAPPSAP